jgi:hypothetical protein
VYSIVYLNAFVFDELIKLFLKSIKKKLVSMSNCDFHFLSVLSIRNVLKIIEKYFIFFLIHNFQSQLYSLKNLTFIERHTSVRSIMFSFHLHFISLRTFMTIFFFSIINIFKLIPQRKEKEIFF